MSENDFCNKRKEFESLSIGDDLSIDELDDITHYCVFIEVHQTGSFAECSMENKKYVKYWLSYPNTNVRVREKNQYVSSYRLSGTINVKTYP